MDLFSHALFPYLLGSYFKKQKQEITAFVIGGIAPDADIFLLWIQYLYPTYFLITHRGITHSIFFGFITGMIVLYIASTDAVKSIVRKKIDYEPVFTIQNIYYCFAGVIIHLIFDYSTTSGIPLFYPVEVKKYSAELFFYTDIFLTILSLTIVLFLFKKPFSYRKITGFLLIFMVFTGGLTAFRIIEKNNAEDFFDDGIVKIFPSINPFEWYAMKEDGDLIRIYEYDGFRRTITYNDTFQRLNVISGGMGLEDAIRRSDGFPQIKMFKWRARSTALNETLFNNTWSLEYYDPAQKVLMRDISVRLRPRLGFGTILVNVTGDRVEVK